MSTDSLTVLKSSRISYVILEHTQQDKFLLCLTYLTILVFQIQTGPVLKVKSQWLIMLIGRQVPGSLLYLALVELALSVTHLKGDLQRVLGHLENPCFWQFSRDADPGVGREHGPPKLLAWDDHYVVWNYWSKARNHMHPVRASWCYIGYSTGQWEGKEPRLDYLASKSEGLVNTLA